MNKVVLFFLAMLLAGCAGMNASNFRSEINERSEKEFEAMKVAHDEAAKICGNGKSFSEIPRKQAVKYDECAKEIYRQKVMPYSFPALFEDMMASSSKAIKQYQSRKINFATLKKKMDTAKSEYALQKERIIQSEIDRLSAIDSQEKAEADKNWALFFQQMNQMADQNYNNAMANRPVHTDCSFYGHGSYASCTSY